MESAWWNDKQHIPAYVLGAGLLFLIGIYMYWGGSGEKAEVFRLQAEKEMVQSYESAAPVKGKKEFLQQAFSAGEQTDYVSLLETAGLHVQDVTEEAGEGNEFGRFHKIFISGTGSFAQILSGFDIIKSEERWNAIGVKEIKRSDAGLAFTIEVRTFQYRGTYEEEKYRPDRSYGNREK